MMDMLVYVGTYSLPILFGTGEILQGKGKGIHILKLDSKTGRLSSYCIAKGIANPSFLTVNRTGTRIYAVNELKEFEGGATGSVSAFIVDKNSGALTLLNTKSTGGQDPCHVCLSPEEKHLVISNFMSGSICVYALEADGSLGTRTCFLQHEGSSIDIRRQTSPHAHSATFDPNGRFVLVPDLGTDRLMTYRLTLPNGKLKPAPSPYYACAPGSGPRYCEFHPELSICYLINELSSTIAVLRYDSDTAAMTELQTVSSLPDDFNGSNTCADLHVSADGRHLYASNRGHNSLSVFEINSTTGVLSSTGFFSSEGKTPRQFALYGNLVLVGNQDSDQICVFRRNLDTGHLEKIQLFDTPTPVCVLPSLKTRIFAADSYSPPHFWLH